MQWENRTAFVYVKTCPGQSKEVYQKFQSNPYVLACTMQPGHYDMMVWLDCEKIGDVYQWIADVRRWGQVEQTSTYPAYYGYWNGKPYQNNRYCGWLKLRGNDFNAAYDYARNHDGVFFCASVPGEYDCFAMVGCDSYEDFFNYVQEFQAKGYAVEFVAPFQTYWNQNCEAKWQQYEKSSCVTT